MPCSMVAPGLAVVFGVPSSIAAGLPVLCPEVLRFSQALSRFGGAGGKKSAAAAGAIAGS